MIIEHLNNLPGSDSLNPDYDQEGDHEKMKFEAEIFSKKIQKIHAYTKCQILPGLRYRIF